MSAWVVRRPGPIDSGPLAYVERAEPVPGARQVRVRISCCGVCRTDLHLALHELPPRRPGTVPGHEVVGRVHEVGADVRGFAPGHRVGVAWLRSA